METVSPNLGNPEGRAIVAEKTEAQKRAQKAYMNKFVRVEIRLTADKRDAIKAHSEARGESVNGFIKRAIDEAMERDNASQK